jgi:hypothetical protein
MADRINNQPKSKPKNQDPKSRPKIKTQNQSSLWVESDRQSMINSRMNVGLVSDRLMNAWLISRDNSEDFLKLFQWAIAPPFPLAWGCKHGNLN